jgi:hypothetical protein
MEIRNCLLRISRRFFLHFILKSQYICISKSKYLLMRKLLLLFLLSSPAYLFAQDFYSKYEELMATGQHGKINALLELWEEESPDDENLHITGFNH